MLVTPPDSDDAPDPASPGARFGGSEANRPEAAPVVRKGLVPRGLLDPDAVAVVRRLQRFGHEAYLVGGCVRDLIAGHEPKDFDVATAARPNQIKRVFRNARIIGRRFRLAHIHFPDGKIIEVSTFRGEPDRDEPVREEPARGAEGDAVADGDVRGEDAAEETIASAEAPETTPESMPERSSRRLAERFGAENVFGTAIEDARRRDLTVNALFYDPVADTVLDWVGGLADLEARVIRCIGDPDVRLAEDPVRMIRSVHFAERLGFRLDAPLEASIASHAQDLDRASGARLYVELHKILGRGFARPTMRRLHELGVLRVWIPPLGRHLEADGLDWPAQPGGSHEEARRGEPEGLPATHATWNLLGAADRWGLAAHGAPESLALAVLFGPWILDTLPLEAGRDFTQFMSHVDATFRPVAVRMSVPRRAHFRMSEILYMLLDLRHPPGPRRVRRLLQRQSFGEALALFRLDLMARDADMAPLDEWEHRWSGDGEHRHRPHRRPGSGAIAPEAASWDEAPPPPGDRP